MSSADQDGSPKPLTLDFLSVLRHELVTPINLIVGYCELLAAEATDQGISSRLAPLQSIRQLGFTILQAVDQILLTDANPRFPADIELLGRQLTPPAAKLVQLCRRLQAATEADSNTPDFAVDLGKIHLAGMQMHQMAEAMARGSLTLASQPQHHQPTEN